MTATLTETELRISFEPFQRRFFESSARFPAFVAGWGTGKTMCGLLKGVLLSQAYRDNLGLVVRRVYKDLHDSTMQDFERYTHLSVPTSSAEIAFPNGSKILFRHGDNLSGLQNINLGWFYMEQGEEFETSDEFTMLRGRLRRELAFDDEFSAAECDEFPGLYAYLRSHELRQGMVIANKAGHNWIWHDWRQMPQSADFELHEATTYDNAANLPADFVADLDAMQGGTETARRKWRIYVNNSWDEVDLEGAYYATLIAALRANGRIGPLTVHPGGPVYTFWDLGVSDSTAIWFAQFLGAEIRIVDYYEHNGEGLAHYAKVLQDKGYVYGGHYAPFDVRQREKSTGLSALEFARGLNLHFEVVPDHKPPERIEAVREMLPNCRIADSLAYGIDVLEHYRRKSNDALSTEERPVFQDTPLHDWACFSGDTKVLTRYGMYPIMQLPKEGEVYTPCGWKHYRNAGKTGSDAPLVAVRLSDGTTVKCTPEHMWLTARGWQFARYLMPATVIRSCSTPSRNTLMAVSTDCIRLSDISRGGVKDCMLQLGNQRSGRDHVDVTSITETATLPITGYPTSNVFLGVNISSSLITKKRRQSMLAMESISLCLPGRKRQSGTSLRLADCGISDTPCVLRVGLSGNENRKYVPSVNGPSLPWYVKVDIPRFTAPQPARPLHIVSVENLANRDDVYCLTVDDGHCFCLGNGAVVHNSHGADAFGHLAIQWRFGRIGGAYLGDSRTVAACYQGGAKASAYGKWARFNRGKGRA
jgi:hypothetical protein